MYRDTLDTLDDLHDHEQLALGGLIRVLIRQDGHFSEAEEAQIEAVASEIGGTEALWRVISRSAQELRDDDAIREVARRVERPAARVFLREVLEGIAIAETIEPGERKLLAWCDEVWGLEGRDADA
jgi:hypothetical protein